MKLLVTGDRNWSDSHTVYWALRTVRDMALGLDDLTEVIEGDAAGADRLAGAVALGLGLTDHKYPADWANHHRAAGPIRNQKMLALGQPTHALAFHHDLSQSKGTADMVRRLTKAGVPVFNVRSADDIDALRAWLRGVLPVPV